MTAYLRFCKYLLYIISFYEDNVYMNLGGIYNENYMNENMEFNKHIDQGIEFKEYGKKYSRENEHKLLEHSSSPEWGSIVEALTGMSSTQEPATASSTHLSSNQVRLNKLISDYSTLYNTYTSTMINKSPADAARLKMEVELISLHAELFKESANINGDFAEFNSSLAENETSLGGQMNKLAHLQTELNNTTNKYDKNTIAGALETTELRTISMYYHYLVYFLISLTLIAFTFNILVNPNANVMSAIIVVSGIIIIYMIAKYYVVPL
jgi:hypothetical protein